MKIVETELLTKQFGKLTAVDQFSIDVEQGEIFGLVGPNGAGKTTVIKILTTLLPATSGKASVAGFDVIHQANKVRQMIGYVPQLVSADGSLSGYENLLIFAKLYNVPRAEQKKTRDGSFGVHGASEAADRLVRNYSGGMIRRLEIALAVLHRPKVLFLDEPTVGLDPVARKIVWEHVKRLRNDYDTTIFLTTHYMEEADTLCRRVAIMHLGKMAAIGTPAELKASVGGASTTLDDVFIHYTDYEIETGGSLRETTRTRRVARRIA